MGHQCATLPLALNNWDRLYPNHDPRLDMWKKMDGFPLRSTAVPRVF